MVDDLSKAKSPSKPSGMVLIDGREVAETVMCVHCGCHWVFQKGSGRRRGWCLKCSGMTCGSKSCDTCMPLEKRLDLYDQGKLKEL